MPKRKKHLDSEDSSSCSSFQNEDLGGKKKVKSHTADKEVKNEKIDSKTQSITVSEDGNENDRLKIEADLDKIERGTSDNFTSPSSSTSPSTKNQGHSDVKKQTMEDDEPKDLEVHKKKIFFSEPTAPSISRFCRPLIPAVRGLQFAGTYASPPYFKNNHLLLPTHAQGSATANKGRTPSPKLSQESTSLGTDDKQINLSKSVEPTSKESSNKTECPLPEESAESSGTDATDINENNETKSNETRQSWKVKGKQEACVESVEGIKSECSSTKSFRHSSQSSHTKTKGEENSVTHTCATNSSCKNTNQSPCKSKKKKTYKSEESTGFTEQGAKTFSSKSKTKPKTKKASKQSTVFDECSKSMPSWNISNVNVKTNEALYRIGLAEVSRTQKMWSDPSNSSFLDSQSTISTYIDSHSEADSIEGSNFTSILMSNIKNRLHYTRFCLSIPKSKIFAIGFQNIMQEADNLLDHYQYSDLSEGQPTEMSVKRAKGIIQDQKERVEKAIVSREREERIQQQAHGVQATPQATPSSNSSTISTSLSSSGSSNNSDCRSDLPHSMVLTISDQNHCMKSQYPGQFVCFVNPKSKVLSFHFFDYVPFYDDNFKMSVESNVLTDDDFKSIQNNMETFELSRELKFEINLGTIIDVKLLQSKDEKSLAILKLVFAEDPLYHQRWIHTSSSLHNRWKSRCKFLPLFKEKDIHTLIVTSFVQEISDMAALIFASMSVAEPESKSLNIFDTEENARFGKTEEAENDLNNDDVNLPGIDVQSHGTIDGILNVLVRHKFISPSSANEFKMSVMAKDNTAECKNNNLVINDFSQIDLPLCLKDYITFRCKDSSDLEQILTTPLSKYNIKRMSKSHKVLMKSIENMEVKTVADLFILDGIFFSFCYQTLLEKNDYYHCKFCQQCSKIKKLPGKLRLCSCCGFSSKGKVILFPQSLFNKGTFHKMLILPPEEPTDIQDFSGASALKDIEIPVDMKNVCCSAEECYQDALGLMDPLAYLLGLKPRESVKSQNKAHYLEKSNKYGKDFITMMSIMTGGRGPAGSPGQGVEGQMATTEKPPMPPMCFLQ